MGKHGAAAHHMGAANSVGAPLWSASGGAFGGAWRAAAERALRAASGVGADVGAGVEWNGAQGGAADEAMTRHAP